MSAPSLTSNELRRLAEAADGYRNQTLCLVDTGQRFEVIPKSDVDTRSLKPLLEVNTPVDGPNLQGASYKVIYKGKEYHHPNVDAVFLSQSAVEKFVFPYYARFLAPAALDRMRTEFYATPGVFAVVHEFPTVYATLSNHDTKSLVEKPSVATLRFDATNRVMVRSGVGVG